MKLLVFILCVVQIPVSLNCMYILNIRVLLGQSHLRKIHSMPKYIDYLSAQRAKWKYYTHEMLHSSHHPNYPNSLVTTYVLHARYHGRNHRGWPRHYQGMCIQNVLREKWIQRTEKLSILCSTFTTLDKRKSTTHTLLSIIYLDKQNTFQMFNLAQDHIHNRVSCTYIIVTCNNNTIIHVYMYMYFIVFVHFAGILNI
jgi:hypothetical protein